MSCSRVGPSKRPTRCQSAPPAPPRRTPPAPGRRRRRWRGSSAPPAGFPIALRRPSTASRPDRAPRRGLPQRRLRQSSPPTIPAYPLSAVQRKHRRRAKRNPSRRGGRRTYDRLQPAETFVHSAKWSQFRFGTKPTCRDGRIMSVVRLQTGSGVLVPSGRILTRTRKSRSTASNLANSGYHESSDATFDGVTSKSTRQGISSVLRRVFQTGCVAIQFHFSVGSPGRRQSQDRGARTPRCCHPQLRLKYSKSRQHLILLGCVLRHDTRAEYAP